MKKLPLFFLALPLVLSACGDNYELVKTDSMFPYGNQRTAGSGVAYVVAKMMPERELNLEPAEDVQEPAAEETPPPPKEEPLEETRDILNDIDKNLNKAFHEAQRK